jgi:protein involved in polysaccharide export with SLBB domain
VYKIGIGDTISFSKLIENNRSPLKQTINWPKQKASPKYRLGIGDTLALTMIRKAEGLNTTAPRTSNNSENNQNVIINSQQNDNTIESKGRIGSDGSVLLLEVGRLEANGKSLNELRSEVRNILIRNGVSPRFQLEIVKFESQKAYLTASPNSSNVESQVIILTDRKTTLVDILMLANVGIKAGIITRIKLNRDNQKFSILLRDLYKDTANNIEVRSNDHIFVENSSETVVTNLSKVDHEGRVIFESVGKVKAAGRSLQELKVEIKNLMLQLPDSQNEFQIQIDEFSSQKALLAGIKKGEGTGLIIPITDKPKTLIEVLVQNGLSMNGNNVTQIHLNRGGRNYKFTTDALVKLNTRDVYVKDGDIITIEILSYKENKVFILGGVTPQIFKINPSNRESLADVLFTANGVLSTASAKRSEVYLLRGNDPIIAYHLDAQSPAQLIVADAMELRPNDILYVAEQPIISFNRTLATIIPLRILLRDIQNENIP